MSYGTYPSVHGNRTEGVSNYKDEFLSQLSGQGTCQRGNSPIWHVSGWAAPDSLEPPNGKHIPTPLTCMLVSWDGIGWGIHDSRGRRLSANEGGGWDKKWHRIKVL